MANHWLVQIEHPKGKHGPAIRVMIGGLYEPGHVELMIGALKKSLQDYAAELVKKEEKK